MDSITLKEEILASLNQTPSVFVSLLGVKYRKKTLSKVSDAEILASIASLVGDGEVFKACEGAIAFYGVGSYKKTSIL